MNRGHWDLASRLLTRVLLGLLVIFHAGLLLLHAVDGRLLEPATSVRWVVGLLLCAGFVALRRLNVPVLWGRKAVVLWLLVVLLHCHAAFSSADRDDLPGFDTTVATMVTEALGATLAALGALALFGVRRRAIPVPARWYAPIDVPRLRLADGHAGLAFAPRPPPAC